MIRNLLQSLFIIILASNNVTAQLSLVPFSTGFTSPVDIKNCGDERLFIVEQNGVIQILDTAGNKNPVPFLDITDRVLYGGERGLLGLAFPPEFQSNGYFYVNYTADTHGDTRISRFHVDPSTPDSADPSSEEILLTIYQPYSNHNGGHLAFGHDGYLYIGTGDGGLGGDPENRAQNPDSLLGKMLRIEVFPGSPTYSIPAGNPFAADTTLGRPEVFDLGLRNPFRWSFDRLTGDLWIGDVGQNAVEEIDYQPFNSSSMNFGWRCYEGNAPYQTGGCQPSTFYDAPVYAFTQASGGYCSAIGGYVYRGAKHQEMYGKYFFTDYCHSEIRYLENVAGTFVHTNLGALIAPDSTGYTAFGEDVHGELYIASQNSSRILKLVSADCTPVATIGTGDDTLIDCGSMSVQMSVPLGTGFNYLWTLNGDTVSASQTATATQEGMYIVNVDNNGCTNSDSVFVDFIQPAAVTFAGLDTFYCDYSSPANLLPTPPGGTFEGAGITNATFDPAQAGAGVHTITYYYTDGQGCSSSYSLDVTVDACLGIRESNDWLNAVRVYPNPSSDNFSMKIFAPSHQELKMVITDVTGRISVEKNFQLQFGENNFNVSHQLSNGIYVLDFESAMGVYSSKLVVRR